MSSATIDTARDTSGLPSAPANSNQSAAASPGDARPAVAPLLARCLALVHQDIAAAEVELARLLESQITVIPKVSGQLAFAGGKRLRPLLTLLCAQAAQFHGPERTTVAAVGELLHTATLLHDDVIDEGEFRRGRPTARMSFGNGMAVLTGDYCLARALQAMANTGHIDAVQSMSDTVTMMAEGEVAQLHGAGNLTPDLAHYNLVIERKTATLIAWCTQVAGLVNPDYRSALRTYGLELGFAFQIADDLLDMQPGKRGPETTGKEPGQDLREGKMTLPVILACAADPKLQTQVRNALREGPPMRLQTLQSIVANVADSSAWRDARNIAFEHADQAIAALRPLPASAAKQALIEVAHYVVRRSN